MVNRFDSGERFLIENTDKYESYLKENFNNHPTAKNKKWDTISDLQSIEIKKDHDSYYFVKYIYQNGEKESGYMYHEHLEDMIEKGILSNN